MTGTDERRRTRLIIALTCIGVASIVYLLWHSAQLGSQIHKNLEQLEEYPGFQPRTASTADSNGPGNRNVTNEPTPEISVADINVQLAQQSLVTSALGWIALAMTLAFAVTVGNRRFNSTSRRLPIPVPPQSSPTPDDTGQDSIWRALINRSQEPCVVTDRGLTVICDSPDFRALFTPIDTNPKSANLAALLNLNQIDETRLYQAARECRTTGHYKNITLDISLNPGDAVSHQLHLIPLQNNDNAYGEILVFVTRGVDSNIDTGRDAEESLKRANEAKMNFLANINHEIRTPMNVISGMCHLALATDLDEKQTNYIEKIDNASKKLLGIVNNILEISTSESGQLHIQSEDFNLTVLCDRLMDSHIYEIKKKRLQLYIDIAQDVPADLRGDSVRLSQVLNDLIDNALKFTERGEIVLKVSLTERHSTDATLKFEVSDTGIGIDENQKSLIFDSFTQLDTSSTRKYGGPGLGLAISKKIIELMGGTIDFTSTRHKGSTFYFTCPFKLSHSVTGSPLTSQPDCGFDNVILISEDACAIDLIKRALSGLCERFTALSDPALFEESTFIGNGGSALIVVDKSVGSSKGIDVTKQLQFDQHNGRENYVCLILDYDQHYRKETLLAHNISGVLHRPLTSHSVRATLSNLLNHDSRTGNHDLLDVPHAKPEHSLYEDISILVVEDSPVNQELLKDVLCNAGINVDLANDGEQAVLCATSEHYDAIFMDCQMPVLDGFEATRRIRKLDNMANVPIIAITGNALKGDREKCLEAGMTAYIAKPIDVRELFSTLNQSLPATTGASTQCHYVPLPMQSNGDEALPETTHLDLRSAFQLTGGNRTLLLSIMRRFAENQQNAVEEIDKALARGDLKAAERAAHTLKGLAGNIGASELQSQAGDVENQIELGQSPGENTLETLQNALTCVLDDIRQGLQSMDGEPGNTHSEPEPVADISQLTQQLARLEQLLCEGDTTAQDLCEEVLTQLNHLDHSGLCSQLKRAIAVFDYAEAQQILIQLRDVLETAENC